MQIVLLLYFFIFSDSVEFDRNSGSVETFHISMSEVVYSSIAADLLAYEKKRLVAFQGGLFFPDPTLPI